jgi:ribose 5-phosphate isomerase
VFTILVDVVLPDIFSVAVTQNKTGKVVGISSGNTVTVVIDRTLVKLRLCGKTVLKTVRVSALVQGREDAVAIGYRPCGREV